MNLSLGVITVHLHAARLLDSFEFNPFIAIFKTAEQRTIILAIQ